MKKEWNEETESKWTKEGAGNTHEDEEQWRGQHKGSEIIISTGEQRPLSEALKFVAFKKSCNAG